ncbi:hypothetical protein BGX28_003757 [Mortierella sp. GBA30]|nr:hypothetical protein BGX28_003757 [Mortierella sp. GBA30]
MDTSSTDIKPSDNAVTPTIMQDDMPLMADSATTTTTLSFEEGIHPAMMDSNPPSTLTETLSSFSSDRSSFLGGSNSNNLLSTFSSTTSTSASRRGSMQFTKPVEVRETLDASVTENADGFKQLKQYILKREIGKGAFGKVLFAVDENTGVSYAVKEFSKSKLRKKDKANLFKLGPRGRGRGRRGPEAPSTASSSSSPLELIRGEVAILKKLHHPNIVKLYEVLDVASDDSMYMVFEMCERGVLMNVSLTEKCESVFSDADCRDVFQQIVLGIEYLHEHDIIHRDIKPDNLLRSGDGTVKIVDFGVSEMFDKKGDDMTKKSAGSPAFMAPELCRPDHGEVSGRATDIWSLGVTLYCLRYGRLPYVSESILEMQRVIREEEYTIPPEDDQRFVNLIKRLLEKDPQQRITIDQLRNDPWLTNDGKEPLISKEENTANAVTEVTEEDLRGAIQKINGLVTVFKAIAKFKRGIKSPVSRSAAATPVAASVAGENVTEQERMQDADEGVPSTSQTMIASTVSESVTRDSVAGEEAQQETVEKKVETTTSDALESSLDRVSIDEKAWTKEAKDESEKDPAEEKAGSSTAEKELEGKSTKEEPEPEGYQMCDMETGMCYWVPFKKATTATPSSSEMKTEETKDNVEDESTKVTEPEEQQSPIIQVASTDYDAANSPSSVTVEEDNASSAGLSSSSGSSSPTRSLTPGPRLVGKLSRERLAMFEKSF